MRFLNLHQEPQNRATIKKPISKMGGGQLPPDVVENETVAQMIASLEAMDPYLLYVSKDHFE